MHEEGDGGCGPVAGPWIGAAYRAYHELLREKIKKKFEAEEGPWMDQVAEALVQIVSARWEAGHKQEREQAERFGRLERLLSE